MPGASAVPELHEDGPAQEPPAKRHCVGVAASSLDDTKDDGAAADEVGYARPPMSEGERMLVNGHEIKKRETDVTSLSKLLLETARLLDGKTHDGLQDIIDINQVLRRHMEVIDRLSQTAIKPVVEVPAGTGTPRLFVGGLDGTLHIVFDDELIVLDFYGAIVDRVPLVPWSADAGYRRFVVDDDGTLYMSSQRPGTVVSFVSGSPDVQSVRLEERFKGRRLAFMKRAFARGFLPQSHYSTCSGDWRLSTSAITELMPVDERAELASADERADDRQRPADGQPSVERVSRTYASMFDHTDAASAALVAGHVKYHVGRVGRALSSDLGDVVQSAFETTWAQPDGAIRAFATSKRFVAFLNGKHGVVEVYERATGRRRLWWHPDASEVYLCAGDVALFDRNGVAALFVLVPSAQPPERAFRIHVCFL